MVYFTAPLARTAKALGRFLDCAGVIAGHPGQLAAIEELTIRINSTTEMVGVLYDRLRHQ
jgi:hypothetical protein